MFLTYAIISEIIGILIIRKIANPKFWMLLPLIIFVLIATATLAALTWSGLEIISGTSEDPLAERLAELQSARHSATVSQTHRRRRGGGFAQQRSLRNQPHPRAPTVGLRRGGRRTRPRRSGRRNAEPSPCLRDVAILSFLFALVWRRRLLRMERRISYQKVGGIRARRSCSAG